MIFERSLTALGAVHKVRSHGRMGMSRAEKREGGLSSDADVRTFWSSYFLFIWNLRCVRTEGVG